MKLKIVTLVLLIGSFLITSVSFATTIESADRIHQTTTDFIRKVTPIGQDETLEITVNQANSQYQIHRCAEDISASLPVNANHEQISSVELTCNDARPWHILVPVEVQVFSKVLVSKRLIPAKEIITEDSVDYMSYNRNRLYNGYFTKKTDVVGNEASHLISPGTVLSKGNVQLPIIVQRNQVISLVARSKSIMVTMQGIAKSDGALNTIIKVYNPSSKRTLDAVVVAPNTAEVVA